MVNHCGFVADIVFSCGRMADVVCGRTDTVSRHYLITYCTCTCRKLLIIGVGVSLTNLLIKICNYVFICLSRILAKIQLK